MPLSSVVRYLTILQILGICFILFLAFVFQVFLSELPCPLCLLQRLGLFFVTFGFLLNLRFGYRPSHYAVALIGALFTSIAALRQVALHVLPGSGAYGAPFLGLHLYTWVYIISMMILAVTIFMMGVDEQYQIKIQDPRLAWVMHTLFLIVILMMAVNIISVFVECGLRECPDNPVNYEWLPTPVKSE